jgi:tetratricopeptide (TPR) repeat protein
MTSRADRAARPAPRFWLVLAGLVAVVGLSLAHPSSSRMLTWPWVLLMAALWVGPPLALLLRLVRADDFHLPARLVTVGLALLAVVTVASAWASPYSTASTARTWPTLSGVALFFLLHDWLVRRGPGQPTVPRTVAGIGGLVIGVSLVEWATIGDAPSLFVRNMFPFGHSNYTAGFIVLVFPWLAHEAWITRGAARVGWAAAVLVALVALATTSSRGGVLALVATGGVAAAAVLVRAPWSRPRKLALLAGLALVGVASILANPRLRDLVVRRSWSDQAQESNQQRSAMLAAGRILGSERPLLGWGPGSVPLAYPQVRARLNGGVDNVLELHNTPVQIWATLGAAGVVVSLCLIVGMVGAAWRGGRSASGAAAAASLGGYAIFALTDHQLDLPLFAGIAALDLALLTAATGDPASPTSWRRGLALLFTAVGLLPALALGRDLRVRQTYDAALDELGGGRITEAVALLDHATRRAPHDPYFQHQAAGALLGLLPAVPEPARRAQITRDVIRRLEASLATGVHEEYAHFNLGWCHLDVGDAPAAARHFMSAARLVPDKGGVYFGLGLALQGAGRPNDAIRAFALEWINDPRSLTSPAWETGLAALRPAVKAEALRLYGELAKTYPRAAVASAWTRWWTGESVSADELGRGFTRDAADFAAALPQLQAKQDVTSTAKWTRLYRAWQTQKFPFPYISDHAAGEAAFRRRWERHRDDFPAFFRAGSEDEAGLVRTFRRSRKGYGVLALHPEGPALVDGFIVQEIGLITDFAADLFPPKGWLPGRYLLALLPPER